MQADCKFMGSFATLAGASAAWFPPLAPAGAQQAFAPAQAGGARGGASARAPQVGTAAGQPTGQSSRTDQSQSQQQWSWSPTSDNQASSGGMTQLGGSSQPWRPASDSNSGGSGGGGGAGGAAAEAGWGDSQRQAASLGVPSRPLLPAEAQGSSSLSSIITAQSGTGLCPFAEFRGCCDAPRFFCACTMPYVQTVS